MHYELVNDSALSGLAQFYRYTYIARYIHLRQRYNIMLVSNSVSEGFQNGSQTPLGLFTFPFIHTSSRILNEQKW